VFVHGDLRNRQGQLQGWIGHTGRFYKGRCSITGERDDDIPITFSIPIVITTEILLARLSIILELQWAIYADGEIFGDIGA
jgi:hypothetical protein